MIVANRIASKTVAILLPAPRDRPPSRITERLHRELECRRAAAKACAPRGWSTRVSPTSGKAHRARAGDLRKLRATLFTGQTERLHPCIGDRVGLARVRLVCDTSGRTARRPPVVVFPSEEQRCRAIHLCGAGGRCKWCGAELQLVRARRREAMIESLHATSRKLMSERASSSLTSGKSAGLSLAASASRALSVARTLGAAAGFCVTRDCHALAHPSPVSGTMT